MQAHSIFSRFLTALGVPHTDTWSDAQFRNMTFKSLYGLSHLLTEYGVPNTGLRFADKAEIRALEPPFLAQTVSGAFVIVTDMGSGGVTYDSLGETQKTSLQNFIDAWNGVALVAFPGATSREPDYGSHRLTEVISGMTRSVLGVAALAVFAYFFVTRGVYAQISTILLTVFTCVGLYFSYLLLQKSLNIHTAASDRVCGVLEQGGCDSIMELPVSKLFGVFSWSEVGFGYFGVSLVVLLLFPHMWSALAVCNVCCLPYTVWSIWYQKFKAKHWCTLCVGVQSTLWLLFFSYLGGGWLRRADPLHVDFLVLLAVYLCAVLALNQILAVFKKLPCHEKY
ncbi:MAG: vitamin K epoxide reductase family protein [Desulfovibrio sp.]|uniref:vitamin K epoxide reductase family protein n=1 Tax=Desulfovibrio sp. TaxID=885 RepID=UPI001A712079|nr:vitamin K epoxide reductase family protein [Desulfovibrio sp.]MBD5416861.1 vitamin K epoxide reductase family protein [Desulfovibrio sp.]